ncbi:hypothetical protein FEE95_13450 [Maribacter algarum]|uniref:Putative auto-transporter adhesin head GIN domain-containing protein n=1 Tax=Maribacter algarum (ex Zhang et al. 2020) TaxID=2578118 RepID=A0A5S3PU75_9FLAO|nr:DUF2807 domain-containing protein [Maribacter algarum]TMM57483.1 hypothetical protein FEE95_13450 [Maribacter algarum]
MKTLFYLVILLSTLYSFSQNAETLKNFESIESNIGAKIHIVKNKTHKIAISSAPDTSSFIYWEVENGNLKIRSKTSNLNYETIEITIYTPSLQVLALSNGGVITMDEKFSRLQSLVVSAGDRAIVDLSNIEFNTLITTSSDTGEVRYKSVNTLVRSSKE